MKKILISIMAIALLAVSCSKAPAVRDVWSPEQARQWADSHGWLRGCDFIPSNAINQLEMWQSETFDPATIDRELGWAEDLGLNCMRVFLHHLVWKNDPQGFKERIGRYLEIADKHNISTIFVFFDDCWNEEYAAGKQPEPKPGVHNSGWVRDPGDLYFRGDTAAVTPMLEEYVKDIMTTFRDDNRIAMWDLYNEPGGSGPYKYLDRSLRLLKNIFTWGREVNPSQPLTAGVWDISLANLNKYQLENSDIVTYHTYENPEGHQRLIDTLKTYGRPMVCTEYMARTQDSRFQNIMPMLREQGIGAISWGLVSGKTNTIFAWDTPLPDVEEPEVWFHDILRRDGTPYSEEETECIRSLTK